MEKILKNFVCENKERTKAKIKRFQEAGKSKVCLVTDFDRTITPFFDNRGQLVSTWDLFTRKMPPEIRAEDNRLYDIYRPLEVAGKLTPEDAFKWWAANLDLFEKSRLKWIELVREIEEEIPARPGAGELFGVCEKEAIPTAIVSAGVRDVIGVWCQKFGIRPDAILSTKLYFDGDGYICGWNRDSLVHILNKNGAGRFYLGNVRKSHPHAILLGDSLDDAAAADGDDDTLRIYVDDRQEKKAKGHDFYDKMFKRFDLAVQSGSLMPVVDIIESLKP